MSWEILTKNTNPELDMFRLDELYDERDKEKENTLDELEVIEMLLRKSKSGDL